MLGISKALVNFPVNQGCINVKHQVAVARWADMQNMADTVNQTVSIVSVICQSWIILVRSIVNG